MKILCTLKVPGLPYRSWFNCYQGGGLGFWVEDTEGFADANKWEAESVAATPREWLMCNLYCQV